MMECALKEGREVGDGIDFMSFIDLLLTKLTLEDLNADPVNLITIIEPFSYLCLFNTDTAYELMVSYVQTATNVIAQCNRGICEISQSEWKEAAKRGCWVIITSAEIMRIQKRKINNEEEENLQEIDIMLLGSIFKLYHQLQAPRECILHEDFSYIYSKLDYFQSALMIFFKEFTKVYFKSKKVPVEITDLVCSSK